MEYNETLLHYTFPTQPATNRAGKMAVHGR
jgi:hypothetical protein